MSAFSDIVVAEGAVGQWRLGEPSGTSAADAIAANNGTYTGTPTLAAAGVTPGDPDTAVTFAAASSQWVDIPTGSYAFANGPYSGECCFKMSASGANFAVMTIPAIGASGNIGIKLGPSANGKVSVMDGGNRVVTSGASPLYNDGKWHHVVFTKIVAGNVWKLYIDGVDVTNADTTPTVATTTPVTAHSSIGADDSSGTPVQFFTGTIDEVAFYNVALTLQQAQRHAINALGTLGFIQTNEPSDGVAAA